MNTLSFTALLTHSLAWALLYSLWQGLLVYGLLFVLLRALGTVSSRVRYYLSVGSFGLLFVWFADTWLSQYQKLKGITVYITQGGGAASPLVTHQATTAVPDVMDYSMLRSSLSGLEHYSSLIITLYCLGLGLMLFRFVVNIWQVGVLKSSGVVAPQAYLNELVQQWRSEFEISRPVQLLLSASIDVPMMLGVIKPVILLPVATINHLSIDQLEAILMHELAHIKRQDYMLNIMQTAAETILFFNPFVWLISGVIRKERENCCDDMVVAHTADPLPYAHALAILETNRSNGGLSLAVTGNKNQLFNRIKRIMEMKKQNINYSQLGIIVMAVIAITCSVAIFTPSFAQKSKLKKDNAADSARVAKTTKVVTYKTVAIDSEGHKTVTKTTTANGGGETVNVSYNDDDVSADINGAIRDIADAAREVAVTISKVDQAKIDREMERAGKEMKQAAKEMKKAQIEMDNIDWDQINAEIKKGLAEADRQLNDPEVKRQISIDVRRGLEEGKAALEEARQELTKKRVAIVMDDLGNVATAKASGSNNDYEVMLNDMEQDGLIDRSRSFKIVKEDGELTINGNAQPKSVYKHYSRYLDAEHVVIKGKKGSLSISMDN